MIKEKIESLKTEISKIEKLRDELITSLDKVNIVPVNMKEKIIDDMLSSFSILDIIKSLNLYSEYLDLKSLESSVMETQRDMESFIHTPLFNTNTIEETMDILKELSKVRSELRVLLTYNPYSR